jgi:hypothetical protein
MEHGKQAFAPVVMRLKEHTLKDVQHFLFELIGRSVLCRDHLSPLMRLLGDGMYFSQLFASIREQFALLSPVDGVVELLTSL